MAELPPMSDEALRARSHLVSELGLDLDNRGDAPRGKAEVFAEACIPGTDVLRTSVIATWADVVTGAAVGRAIAPRIPMTLDLEVQVVTPVRLGTTVAVEASTVKAGRRVAVTTCTFRDAATDAVLAISYASFVAAPGDDAVFPNGFPLEIPKGRLAKPLAERIERVSVAPGIVEIPHRPDGLNAVGAIQGGLLAFAAEEAASSLVDGPVFAESLAVRYLRPFVIGPARAEATHHGAGLSVVGLTDVGSGKLGLVATVRTRPIPA